MKLKFAVAVMLGLVASVCFAGTTSDDTTFSFTTINVKTDTFTQLLGVNNSGVIAGYHGSGAAGHPNQGFTLIPPSSFTVENFPMSVQTQVIGINDAGVTDGFYIDNSGVNHGFIKTGCKLSELWISPTQLRC